MNCKFSICQEHHSEEHNQEISSPGEHPEHALHSNHIALLLNGTTNLTHHNTMFTVGLDYERRINKKLGIGMEAEFLFGKNPEILVEIPMFFHINQGMKFYVAPLALYTIVLDEEPAGSHNTDNEHVSNTNPLSFGFRVCAEYDFHISKYSITPGIAYDYIDGSQAIIYGVGFGLGF